MTAAAADQIYFKENVFTFCLLRLRCTAELLPVENKAFFQTASLSNAHFPMANVKDKLIHLSQCTAVCRNKSVLQLKPTVQQL